MCTSGAKPKLHLIPLTTDLTNIPADFSVLASGIKGPEGPAIGPDGHLYLVSAEHIPLIYSWREREFPKLFPSDSYPPNTLLVIERLVNEAFLIEVQTVAAL